MAQEQHTPGPWITDAECGDESVLGPDGFMVADCAIFSMRKGGPTEERNRANARLIAAAPDMLDALIAADGLLRDLGHSLPQVKAAIAQASPSTRRDGPVLREGVKNA